MFSNEIDLTHTHADKSATDISILIWLEKTKVFTKKCNLYIRKSLLSFHKALTVHKCCDRCVTNQHLKIKGSAFSTPSAAHLSPSNTKFSLLLCVILIEINFMLSEINRHIRDDIAACPSFIVVKILSFILYTFHKQEELAYLQYSSR